MSGEATSQAETFQPVFPLQLYAELDQGAVLITSNQRLSRFRLQAFETEQQRQHKRSWPTPKILPWSAWIQQQWLSSGLAPCLSPEQESLLWRRTILEDPQTEVLNPKALSKQAMEAWKILSDYQIDPSCLQESGEEHLALWRWGDSVQKKTDYFLQHQVLEQLSRSIQQTIPKRMILDGFDSFAPAQLSYFRHLQALGTTLLITQSDRPEAELSFAAYPDEDSELRDICFKVRQLIKAKPQLQVGILIPGLEQRAERVARVCREELAPSLPLQLGHKTQGNYFNLSLGSPLARQPMVQTAFDLLSLLGKQQIQHREFSKLLLNPYIHGHGAETHQRASLDKAFRDSNQFTLSLKQFISWCEQSDKEAHEFSKLLQTISELQQKSLFSGKQRLSQWLMHIEHILQQLNWQQQAECGDELAQLQSWSKLIEQLTRLDDYCGEVSWHEAIGILHEHAQDQVFRPNPSQANIQIMGLLEASNLYFDHLFIIGMDDLNWPPAAKPHPLIPFYIQTLYKTPHSNSEREWEYAQAVWKNLLHISPIIEVSFAKTTNNQDVQLSPLLQHGKQEPETEIHQSQRYSLALQQQQASLTDIAESQWPVLPQEKVRGGTGLLKAQASCAFQAFVLHRLNLTPLQLPSPGLNAAEQGIILHAALELFWKKVKTQSRLLQLDDTARNNTIRECIDHSWSSLNRVVPFVIRSLETQRLFQLISRWLTFETQRNPFEVKAFEEWRNIRIGTGQKLALHTKIDRIDRDGEGHCIILDYKTGESSASKAVGEQLSEPQLPTYFMAEKTLQHPVDAVAFAQVRNGAMAFKGFAREDHILPGIKAFKGKKDQPENWEELSAEWHDVIHRLADEFMAGESAVLPKHSQSCNYCQLAGICQIYRSD